MDLQEINAAASPEVQMNENFAALNWAAVFAMDARTTSGLTWGHLGGRWGGFPVTAGTNSLANNDTNYISVKKSDATISVEAAEGSPAIPAHWADTTNYVRAYVVPTSSGNIVTASIEDHRAGPNGLFG